MTSVDRLVLRLGDGLLVVAVAAVAAMAIHITAEIIARTFFAHSFDGTIQIVSHYYMVAIIYLPWMSVHAGRHMMASEIVTARLSPRANRFIDRFVDLLLAAWLGGFAWMTGLAAMERTQSHEFVETTYDILTIWPSRWILPIGAGAAALYALLQAFRAQPASGAETSVA